MAEKDKKSKPNFVQTWYRETVGELRKVSWPTWPEARRLTIMVIAVMVVMGLILGTIDFASREGVSILLGIR